MYILQRLRYHSILDDVQRRLRNMALDPRAFPGIASEVRQLKSSASTPSLRSRESEVVPMGRATPDNAGGNVRVVVRVRGFLPRGRPPFLGQRLSLTAAQRLIGEQSAWWR